MPVSCIVLFSGGLDSTIAVHLLTQQNIAVTALHFVAPFDITLNGKYETISERSRLLGVPLQIIEQGEDFTAMMKDPRFGFGKNANPCMDCRIQRLTRAHAIMRELGASFIATGEVLGQRPMSQRRDCLDIIEKLTGLRGLLLRPLCAKLLPATIPEEKKWVDRERLLAISGRSRKEQIAYAAQFGLTYSAPAGGCLLTLEPAALRFEDLRAHTPDFSVSDIRLIGLGRHFRLNPECKLIVGRNEEENLYLLRELTDDDYRLSLTDFEGPLGIVRGKAGRDDLLQAARILVRFSKARNEALVRITAERKQAKEVLEAKPAEDEECARYRIGKMAISPRRHTKAHEE
jgi:tRNA U34 2-thiouridine synthase MnmA/TrmU